MADFYSKQLSMFILFYESNVALSARCYRKISSIDSLCDVYIFFTTYDLKDYMEYLYF